MRATIDVPGRARGRPGLGGHPGPTAIAVLAALFPALASDYWIFNVEVGLVLAIACLGLVGVVGWLREISLVQAGLTGSALYITGYLYRGSYSGLDVPLPRRRPGTTTRCSPPPARRCCSCTVCGIRGSAAR